MALTLAALPLHAGTVRE